MADKSSKEASAAIGGLDGFAELAFGPMTAHRPPVTGFREDLVSALDEAMCGGGDELLTEHDKHRNYAEILADAITEPGRLADHLGLALDQNSARKISSRGAGRAAPSPGAPRPQWDAPCVRPSP